MSYCVFLFTSSCLLEGICLIVFSSLPPVACWRVYVLFCVPLYLQLLVGGYMSYCVFLFTSSYLLEGICLIVFSSLPPVVCWRCLIVFCVHIVMSKILSYHMTLPSEFRVMNSATISVKKLCSGRFFFQLFVGEFMS